MSLKQELQVWSDALAAYDSQDYARCLALFQHIDDTSKVQFNIGIIHATLGRHELALQSFESAIELDEYLAIAYFQSGVSNFMLERYTRARRDFDNAFIYLRSNMIIDYEQIGLKYRLYSCEILFNRGLASIYLGQHDLGMRDLQAAIMEKQRIEHGVIDDAIADRAEGYTVFSIPVGNLFRPSPNKLRNLETKNYLGQAKLVAATDAADAFTGFTGTVKRVGGLESRSLEEEKHRVKLSRSKTSAARLQQRGNIDGLAPPLRRRPTADSAVSGPRSPRAGPATEPAGSRVEEESINAVIRFIKDDQLELVDPPQESLPTPPSSNRPSSEIQRQQPSTSRRTTSEYEDLELIGSYLTESTFSSMVQPLRPSGSRPEGQPIDRVADSAEPATRMGRPPLSRQASATASVRRHNTLPSRVKPLSVMVGDEQESVTLRTSTGGEEKEMSKVRVKLRLEAEVRGMSITPDLSLKQFKIRVKNKFEAQNDMPMKYTDTEGVRVSLVDEDDWETAMDSAREMAQGRAEGKLEIILSSPSSE